MLKNTDKIFSKENLEKYKLLLFVIFILGIYAMIIKMINPDSDMWFLAATGRYIVKNKTIPTTNPFIIHNDFNVIIQQWIVDIINYFIFNNFGFTGIYLYSLSMFFVNLYLLNIYLKNYINNKKRIYIVLFFGLYLLEFANSRPTCLSFAIVMLLLIFIEKYLQTNNKKYLIALPILSLLEINIHSAMWPMLFVLIIPYIFPRGISKKENLKKDFILWFDRNKYILLAMAFMFICGFINPNGINGMLYLVKSYGSASKCNISELQSAKYFSLNGFLILIVIAIYIIYFSRIIIKNKKIKFDKFYMASGTLLLSIICIRNMWYLIIGISPLLAMLLNDIQEKTKENTTSIHELRNVCILRSLYVCIILSIFINSVNYNYNDSASTPIKAVEYLESFNKDNIKLFNGFNNGNYLEWSGYKVYFDARPELFDSKINNQENIIDEYLDLRIGKIDFDAFLEKYNFTHLIVTDGFQFGTYLDYNENYDVVVIGEGYKLYEKVNN